MKFDSGNQVFVSKRQVMYLRVCDLPNKRLAKEYKENYDLFFVKTFNQILAKFSVPLTLEEVLEQSDRSDWIVTTLEDGLTKTEKALLESKGYKTFIIYQPPAGEPLVAWALIGKGASIDHFSGI